MIENEISALVIGAAIDVHREIGPGCLESAYEACLAYELTQRGLHFERQVLLPLVYKEVRLNGGYRIDLLVEDKVIIELKSVDALANIHFAQLLTYLRLKDVRLGLLINFNTALLTNGIKRVVNKL